MKKLFNIKKWLTIKDAARYLSLFIGEEISEVDILRLGLDGNLVLSVYFVNKVVAIKLKLSKIIDPLEYPYLEDNEYVLADPLDGEYLYIPEMYTESIDGVFDLPVIGSARLDVEQKYQEMTGGPQVKFDDLAGILVQDEDRMYWALQNSLKSFKVEDPDGSVNMTKWQYSPNNHLPPDCVLVVRTSALQSFVECLNEPVVERPLGSRERKTLLVVIAALAKAAKISLESTGKAAGYIEGLTAGIGARVSKRAIENHLNLIPDALESRME